jgi:hypothetical protein
VRQRCWPRFEPLVESGDLVGHSDGPQTLQVCVNK